MGSGGLPPPGGGSVAAAGRGRAGGKLYIIYLLCQSGGRGGVVARGLSVWDDLGQMGCKARDTAAASS